MFLCSVEDCARTVGRQVAGFLTDQRYLSEKLKRFGLRWDGRLIQLDSVVSTLALRRDDGRWGKLAPELVPIERSLGAPGVPQYWAGVAPKSI